MNQMTKNYFYLDGKCKLYTIEIFIILFSAQTSIFILNSNRLNPLSSASKLTFFFYTEER